MTVKSKQWRKFCPLYMYKYIHTNHQGPRSNQRQIGIVFNTVSLTIYDVTIWQGPRSRGRGALSYFLPPIGLFISEQGAPWP